MSFQVSEIERRIIQKSTFRAVDLIENYFTHPKYPSEPLVLDTHQKDFIDCIQFGFPLSYYRFSEFEKKKPPKGVITIWRRQVGKSYCCAWGVSALMIIDPPCAIGLVAASESESQLLIDKIKWVFENSKFKNYVEGRPKLTLFKLKNGSYCQSHTCSETNIRGPSYDVIIIDESALMDEKILFGAALPTVTHGRRWVAISTPKGKKGQLIDFYYRGLESRPIVCRNCGERHEQSHFKVDFPQIKFMEMPPLPNCKCGANNYKYGMGLFAVPYLNPWKCTIIDPEELKALLDLHDWSPLARQEYLGEIIDEASMVILKEWLTKNRKDTLRNTMVKEEGITYVLGVDYGRQHDASCFCITHRDRKTDRIVLDYMRTISGEFDKGTDYSMIKSQLLKVIKFYEPYWVVADATGLGDPLVEELKRDIDGLGLKAEVKIFNNKKDRLGFVISVTTKPELITNMIALLSRSPHALDLPPVSEPEMQELENELLKFECEIREGGYIKYGTQNYHDDRLIAFALSLWGHRGKIWYEVEAKFFDYGVSKMSREVMDINFNITEDLQIELINEGV